MKSYTLISGRSIEQAAGMHAGKRSELYERVVYTIEMNAADMEAEAVAEGEFVRLISQWGSVRVRARKSSIPRGMIFIPMGPAANAVSGVETEGTGMPLFKGFAVEVEKEKRDERED